MSSTLLRVGLWIVLIVIVLYVLQQSFEESPLAEYVTTPMLQKALALGIHAAIAGQLFRVPDRGAKLVPKHLFDIGDADGEFNAADFARAARAVCDDIAARGRRAILAGGTFFYLRAFLRGLPEMPGRDADVRARIRALAARPRGQARL